MTEGNPSGIERLKSKTTLKEILEVATTFEASARDFYTNLAPKVSKKLRWLADDLAKEEQRHYELFTELAQRPDIADQIKEQVEAPITDTKFSDAVHTPDLGDNPDDQAVLQYAMSREHLAMEHYQALAETTPAGPIKDLFVFLAKEETQHKQELEKLYYEVVHSGGV